MPFANWNWRVLGLVGAAIAIGIFIGWRWMKGYQFHEVSLDGQKDVLRELEKRITLKVNTTSQEGLLGVVGLVLVVDTSKATDGQLVFNRSDVIPNLRPSSEAVLVSQINKTLYEGKVSNTLNAGGSYTAISGDLNANQSAEMIIVDELYMGFRDPTKIPYDKLYELKPPLGKAYYFVEAATVTSTTYRTFDEVTSSGTLEGAAFKANGKVYTSNRGFAYAATVAIETFNVQALRPTEDSAGNSQRQIRSLYRRHQSGQLEPPDAKELVGLLKEASPDAAALSGSQIRMLGD